MRTLVLFKGLLPGALILVFQFSIGISAYSATCTFTGNGDGTSWSDDDNWSCGDVPDPQSDHVIIPAGFNVVNDEPNDFGFQNGMDFTIHGSLDMNDKKIEMKDNGCFLHISSSGRLFDVKELFFNTGGEGLFDAGCDIEVDHLKVDDDSEIIVNTVTFIVYDKLENLSGAGIFGVGCIDYRGSNGNFVNTGDGGIFGCFSSNMNNCDPLCGLIWTGNTDTRWHLASNWNQNRVPNANDMVLIPDVSSASGNFPIVSTHVTIHTVIVAIGASVTIATDYGMTVKDLVDNDGTFTLKSDAYFDDFTYGGTFSGNMTVERLVQGALTGAHQHFFTSPVNNPNVSQLGDDLNGLWGTGLPGTNGVYVTPLVPCNPDALAAGSNYGNLFELDESLMTDECGQSGWIVRSAGTLQNGKGYSAYFQAGSTAEVSGTPNSGTIVLGGLTNTNGSDQQHKGWNLIGNPYPSPVNTLDFLSSNGGLTSPSQYQPSGPYNGTFQAYSNGDNIAISQGFQVKGSGSVTFNNSMRNTGSTNWTRDANWYDHKLDIIVEGNGFMDASYIYFHQEATQDFDQLFDREKKLSSHGQPTLFTNTGEGHLSYNAMSSDNITDIIPLGLDAGSDGHFTLNFNGLESFDNNVSIYLEDKLTGKWTDLGEVQTYSFDMMEEEDALRFNIHFEESITTHIEDHVLGNIRIYSTGDIVYLDLRFIESELLNHIQVYNISGQMITELGNAGRELISFDLDKSATGCYLVRITNDEAIKTQKIIVLN